MSLPGSSAPSSPKDCAFLQHRWSAGCHHAPTLWAELHGRGISCSLRQVQRPVSAWRPGLPRPGLSPPPLLTSDTASPPAALSLPLSPRQATWLLLHPPADLTAHDRIIRDKLLATIPLLNEALTAIATFRQMLRTRERAAFDPWLAAAERSALPGLRVFAASLRRDYAAVAASLDYAWSSGQAEGQVTKIKLCKRQMYGRASFDLLRRRVLLAC